MTSSASAEEGLKKPEDPLTPKKPPNSPQIETNFNGVSENKTPVPSKPPSPTTSNTPPNYKEVTGSLLNQTGSNDVTSGGSPVRNTLTPTTTLLGTVQRRLSFANSNLAEGRTERFLWYYYFLIPATHCTEMHIVNIATMQWYFAQ